jgi:hypothetical protein
VKLRIVALGGTLPNPPEHVYWGDLRNEPLIYVTSLSCDQLGESLAGQSADVPIKCAVVPGLSRTIAEWWIERWLRCGLRERKLLAK